MQRGPRKVCEAGDEQKEPEPRVRLGSHSLQDKPRSVCCLFSSVTVPKILILSEPQLAHL